VRLLRKVAGMLRTWPPKHERQAAIAAARRERERSEAGVPEARRVAQDLRRLSTNHYANDIVRQILRGHQPNGG